jgi:hypothetical protein
MVLAMQFGYLSDRDNILGASHSMLKTGTLNPSINSLLSRVRHTNTLVIAD